MNTMQQQVFEFYKKFVDEQHWKFKWPLSKLDEDRKLLRVSLLLSEVAELSEAIRNKKRFEIIDGICDCIYILLGTAIEMGIDVQPYFNEIHRSNMTKTKAIDEGGKIQKGPEYSPPDLASVFRSEPFASLTD